MAFQNPFMLHFTYQESYDLLCTINDRDISVNFLEKFNHSKERETSMLANKWRRVNLSSVSLELLRMTFIAPIPQSYSPPFKTPVPAITMVGQQHISQTSPLQSKEKGLEATVLGLLQDPINESLQRDRQLSQENYATLFSLCVVEYPSRSYLTNFTKLILQLAASILFKEESAPLSRYQSFSLKIHSHLFTRLNVGRLILQVNPIIPFKKFEPATNCKFILSNHKHVPQV